MAGFVDWGRGLLEQLRNDPALRMSLFQTGAGFMRTPGWGQSGWDVASDALSSGVNTLYMLRERDRDRREREQERAFRQGATTTELGLRKEGVELQRGTQDIYRGEVTSQQAERAKRSAREERALPSEIAGREAQAAQARTGAAENIARAELLRRTDPKLRGGAGGGAGGFDVQSLDALTEEYISQGMDPVEARAKAAREIRQAKTPTARENFTKAVNDRIKVKMDAQLGIVDEPTMLRMRNEAVQEVTQEMQQAQARADKPAREKLVGKKFSWKSRAGGPDVVGTVTNVVEGRATILFPDGSTKVIPVEKLTNETPVQ